MSLEHHNVDGKAGAVKLFLWGGWSGSFAVARKKPITTKDTKYHEGFVFKVPCGSCWPIRYPLGSFLMGLHLRLPAGSRNGSRADGTGTFLLTERPGSITIHSIY